MREIKVAQRNFGVAQRGVAAQRSGRKPLPEMVEVAPNPLAKMNSEDIVAASAEIIDTVKDAFQKADTKFLEVRGVGNNSLSGYYLVLVFGSDEQANVFRKAIGVKEDDQYADGRQVADRLGIAIPQDSWEREIRSIKRDERLAHLAERLE